MNERQGRDVADKKLLTILTGPENKRVALGIARVANAAKALGYTVQMQAAPENAWEYRDIPGKKLYCGVRGDAFLGWLEEQELLLFHRAVPEGEGFYLQSIPAQLTAVCGGSDTGVLYGCLELVQQMEETGAIPAELAFYDAPAFKLRGPCIGLQKTKLEPPRHTYEYPITPSRFPWFYNKQMWEEFLEMMLTERCNVLYLWSGHPFSSLVRVPDYPEALEVTEEEFALNREIFGWLTEECDRRGIWVVLKFYNIHISYPFAQKHGLDLMQSNIHPLVADYTHKSIVEFIKSFPHIGLMVCLGEALRGVQNKTDWFVKTIIPAVKQGVLEAGITEEPPVILRGHDCDPVAAMEGAMPQYGNLYTMWKYNGESLTTYLPRGKWQKLHESLSAIGTTHIMNVHILANLEPFRFNAPAYIQKCVQAGSFRFGANGLHLYPLFYWDWPYAPDKAEERILQLHRDWMWFGAWFRYAWNPARPEREEAVYWTDRVAAHYGISRGAAKALLTAMEAMGNCAPKLLGRVGITEGNRQTMSLGMLMSQLTNVVKYRPNRELWNSVARVGEQPDDYCKRERAGEPHIGETPFDLIDELNALLATMRAARADVAAEAPEASKLPAADALARIDSDLEAVALMIESYCHKIRAAMFILQYKYSMDDKCRGDIGLLEAALPDFEASLQRYRALAALTEKTYLYANSMQTPQRKIPLPDGDAYGHWVQCLPVYEAEFAAFRQNIDKLKTGWSPCDVIAQQDAERLPEAPFTLDSTNCEMYTVKAGESLFTDSDSFIQTCAAEVGGMTGVRFGMGEAIVSGVTVRLTLAQDSKVLIGYFNDKGVEWLQVPELETNTHADDRGGLSVVYAHALKAQGCKSLNVHAFTYEKGTHDIYFGTGCFAVLGVVPVDAPIIPRNAGLEGEGPQTLDWLYEDDI